MNKKIKYIAMMIFCQLVLTLSLCANPLKDSKPNVILFFMDDMGYADIGAFGAQKSKTPNIDRLANEGLKFTDFYNGWTACSPSRASLMTGSYAGRIEMDGRVCFPNQAKALNPKEHTMAEMFKSAGYATGIFGKWHLGHLPGYLPLSHGFDEYWGIPYSNDMWHGYKDHYPPLPFIHNNEAVAIVDSKEDHQLLQQAYHEKLMAFLKKNKDKPFFAYVPHSAVHIPQIPKKEYMAAAKGSNAALMQEVDGQVGEVLQYLKDAGIDDNTIVLFLSDNGGIGKTERQPLRGGKGPPEYEGHMRTMLAVRWPAKLDKGKVCSAPAVTIDFLPTFAQWVGGKLSDNKIDGKDISKLFTDPETAISPHAFMTYREGGIRVGDWKALKVGKDKYALFNLKEDIGEANDLSEKHPEKLKELMAQHKKWYEGMKSEMRPHARMENVRPLVSAEEAKKYPTLQQYLKDQ